ESLTPTPPPLYCKTADAIKAISRESHFVSRTKHTLLGTWLEKEVVSTNKDGARVYIYLTATNNSVLHLDLSFITLAATNNTALHLDLSLIALTATNNTALHLVLSFITLVSRINSAFHPD